MAHRDSPGNPFPGQTSDEVSAMHGRMRDAVNSPAPAFQPGSTVQPGGTATRDFTSSGESIRGRATPGGALVKGSAPAARGTAPSKPESIGDDAWKGMSQKGQRAEGNHSPGQAPQRTVNAASKQRSDWEATDVGKARMRDMSALTADRPAHEQRTPGQHGFERNYDRKTVGPKHYDTQLPGMADPNAAPRPAAWHELSSNQQEHTHRALAEQGTSIEQISKDFGAQYDQGAYRAEARDGHGADAHAEHFYSTGAPRQKIDESAKDLGIPSTIHAHMNAITSPNTKFEAKRGKTMANPEEGASPKRVPNPDAGQVYYPNDEAAVHAVKHVQKTGSAKDISNVLATTDPSATGKSTSRPANIDKAARSYEQYEKGVPVGEWETGAKGAGPFDGGPKTGPYSNSWSDTHPQFLVSDVHSGGGGAFPHLGASKFDTATGKSEREVALEKVPFAHSAIDEAGRQAMHARNLPSVRSTQEIQWGEEQNQRKEAGSLDGSVEMPPKRADPNATPSRVVPAGRDVTTGPPNPADSRTAIGVQGELFSGTSHKSRAQKRG